MATAITDTQGIIAIAAVAVAAIALAMSLALMSVVRRLRRSQRVVIGQRGERDVVAHAADLQDAFEALREFVEEMAAQLDGRLAGAERTLRGTLAHRSLVHYDAYNELSGQQSLSIALLDNAHSGIVLSCIHHRDQARVYAKQIHQGRGELKLSPEEEEAVQLALSQAEGGGQADVAAGQRAS